MRRPSWIDSRVNKLSLLIKILLKVKLKLDSEGRLSVHVHLEIFWRKCMWVSHQTVTTFPACGTPQPHSSNYRSIHRLLELCWNVLRILGLLTDDLLRVSQVDVHVVSLHEGIISIVKQSEWQWPPWSERGSHKKQHPVEPEACDLISNQLS